MIKKLSDSNSNVKSSAAWCIKKITDYHCESLIANKQFLENFINTIIQNLYNNKNIVIFMTHIINNLSIGFKESNISLENNYFEEHIPNLLNNLLTVANTKGAYNTNNNVASSCYFSIGILIDNSSSNLSPFIQEFFAEVINSLNFLYEAHDKPKEEKEAYENYLFTVIHACLSSKKIDINMEQAKFLYNKVKAAFVRRDGVFVEGLLVCGGLAISLEDSFVEIYVDFAHYLSLGFDEDNEEIARNSILVASDIINSLRNNQAVIENIISKVLNICQVI